MEMTVIGAGKSGISSALLAVEKGFKVFLTELQSAEKYSNEIELLNQSNIEYEFGGHSEKALRYCDLIVTSPGVPPNTEIIRNAEKKGITIISEIEFAYRYLKNPIIAITGTNGKTTTTAMTAFMLNHGGKKAIACGNIGVPLSSLVGEISDDDILVIEVSSFQLDRIVEFAPEVAIILNITPDHLYYHGSLENYIASKIKISTNQNEKNFLFLNNDDEIIKSSLIQTKAVKEWFSFNPVERGIYIDRGIMKIRNYKQYNWEEIMHTEEIRLPGIHNVYNSMASALAARVFEISNENIRDSLMAFSGVNHRLEFVRSINGVDVINDSKATNVNAAWFALASYNKPIIWIAGGRGEQNNYSLLDTIVRKNVKTIIAIGEDAENIFNHFCTITTCIRSINLQKAVLKAVEISNSGDVILFSPACKSFDMFVNYEHRGEVFKEIVNEIDG